MKRLIYLNLFIPLLIPAFRPGEIFIVTAIVIIPGILFLMNITMYFRGIEKSVLKCTGLMLLGLYLALLIGYLRWGITTGNLFHPDAETVWLNLLAGMYYLVFSAISFLIFYFGKKFLARPPSG